MSSVLVIGANSALAQVVIKRLQTEHEVTGAGRHDCDVVIDVTQPISILDGTQVAINFTAAFDDDSEDATMKTVQTNVVGVLRLAAAARQAGVKHFVQISSMSAVHDSRSPYYSLYAITKRQADELLQWYCDKNHLKLTILRPSQLYGSELAFAKHQPFFYDMINAARSGQDITIYGTNDPKRNYLHAQDFSEIVAKVLTHEVAGVYPCLYPSDVTFSQIAETAQNIFSNKGRVIFLKDKADTPDNIFEMNSDLYERINFRPQVTLDEGIKAIKFQAKDSVS